jgi:hypothetical protein
MDLTDVYRIFHPTTTQYAFFTAAHRTFSKIDKKLKHKASSANTRKQYYPLHLICTQCINTRNSTT